MKQIYFQLTYILLLLFTQNLIQAQELVFAKSIGSDSPDSFLEQGNSIALDETGNILVTGTIGAGTSGAIFGEGETNETTLDINGSFLAKYEPSGELLWVQQMGASNNGITSYAIDADLDGNIYVSGRFFQEATFGVGQTNETTLTGTSGEIFLAKYDADGSLVWALSEGGDNDDNGGRGLEVDDNGNIYLTGSFWGTVTFAEGESSETTFTSESSTFFLAKYDTNGALVWIQRAESGSNHSSGKNLDIDNRENIYITGNYFNSVTFGEGLSNETTLNDGNESAYIAKYDKNGDFIWAIDPSSSGKVHISGDLQTDSEGSVLFTGSFFGTITLGQGTQNEMQLSGTGLDEIIVAKYSSEGEFIWAKSAESTSDDRGVGLAVDSISNVFITGYFGSQIQFGGGERNDTTIVNSGSSDLFIAKFSPSGEFIWVTAAGGSEWEQGKDIQVDKVGNLYLTGFYRSNITFGSSEPMETSLSIEGFNDIFIAKFERSFNAAPTFELNGNTNFLEDFSGTQTITANQINTPDNELNQIISYSISPESSNLLNLSFDSSSGVLEVSALENKFGEETFTIIADDGEKENYLYIEEFSIVVDPVNDPPVITGSTVTYSTPEETSLTINLNDFIVEDPDNEFPTDFTLVVGEGDNYSVTNNEITPELDFNGTLTVPVLVNDGTDDSEIAEIPVEVTPVNDPPVITGSTVTYSTPEETSLTINLNDFIVEDPDNEFPTDFTLVVGEGDNYLVTNNIITPKNAFVGVIDVPITVNDGTDSSEPFEIMVEVNQVLGLDKDFIQENFSVYPNPTTDYVIIQPNGTSITYDLAIYNLNGILLFAKKNLTNSKKEIDLSKFSKGLYLLKIVSESKVGTITILKK